MARWPPTRRWCARGYPVERWERPLGELAAQAGPETVVIFAEPFTRERDDIKAVRQILESGGRVLATGYWGGFLLPGAATRPRETRFRFAACKLEPQGLDPLAEFGRGVDDSRSHLAGGQPRVSRAVRAAPASRPWWSTTGAMGHVVWWASSTPLENGSLARAQNLDLLLNSLGPREGQAVLLGRVAARRDPLHVELCGRAGACHAASSGCRCWRCCVLFSFSRRSGPVRDLPPPVRATPIEFLEALGSLYRNAGAASTAVASPGSASGGMRCGCAACADAADGCGANWRPVLRRRFPGADESLEADLTHAKKLRSNDALNPKEALRLVQLLSAHLEELNAMRKPGAELAQVGEVRVNESAS